MIKLSNRQHINVLKDRLARIEHGELLGSDYPRHYTSEERLDEIARIKAEIAALEVDELS